MQLPCQHIDIPTARYIATIMPMEDERYKVALCVLTCAEAKKRGIEDDYNEFICDTLAQAHAEYEKVTAAVKSMVEQRIVMLFGYLPAEYIVTNGFIEV